MVFRLRGSLSKSQRREREIRRTGKKVLREAKTSQQDKRLLNLKKSELKLLKQKNELFKTKQQLRRENQKRLAAKLEPLKKLQQKTQTRSGSLRDTKGFRQQQTNSVLAAAQGTGTDRNNRKRRDGFLESVVGN